MIPSFRWNSGSSSSTPLRDSTSTRSASSWASLAEYLTRGFLEQPYPDARLHPLQHLGWIGNTYLDDSGRDSPASLNSTGDM